MSEVKTHRITCIVCPLGCEIEVKTEGDKILEINGYKCPRAKEYAIQEITAPKRIVISVVNVKGSYFPTVSVKTNKPILKKLIPQIMRELSTIELEAPVPIGKVILKNVANSGVSIITTRPAPKSR